MARRAFTWALLLLLTGASAAAEVLTVPTDHTTIQAALNAATSGDTITVLAGTYSGPGNRDLDFGAKNLRLVSEPMDPAGCIIQCDGTAAAPHRGFWFHSGETTDSVVRGFTITGGYALDSGGGVLIGGDGAAAAASFEFCILTGNEAPSGAGLAVASGPTSVRLADCTLDGNLGDGMLHAGSGLDPIERCTFNENSGRGFATTLQAFILHDGRFSDCAFDGNDADGLSFSDPFGRLTVIDSRAVGNGGWGIRQSGIQDGIIHLDNVEVTDNQAGGVYAVLYGGVISNCLIADNTGHGIHTNPAGSPFFVQISHTMISDNTGWGLHLTGSVREPLLETSVFTTTVLSHCTIRGNGAGGLQCLYAVPIAIRFEDNLVNDNLGPGAELSFTNPYMGSVLFRRNTLTGNSGAGILTASTLPCTLQANLVAFNQGTALDIQNPDSLVVLGHDHYGNQGGDWTGDALVLPGVDGNFSANPLFVAPELEDFRLAANSPCLPGQHPDGYDGGQIGAEPEGGSSMTYSPTLVDLAPPSPVQLHPNENLSLTVRIFDAGGAAVPDEGTVPTLSNGAGLGTFTGLSLDADGITWNSDYTAGPAEGLDTLVAHDPECAVLPFDSLTVNVTQAAIVESVRDIPDDQGLQVRVIWRSACADHLGEPDPVTFYTVWRRVPEAAAADRPRREHPFVVWTEAATELYLDNAGALWEPAGPSVPAMLWDRYAMVCPTLRDSTAVDAPWSVFQVSAHQTTPQTFTVSWPDSGRSVDDLAPDAPTGLVVAVQDETMQLSWTSSLAFDVVGYRIYGLPVDAVHEDQAVVLGITTAEVWLDLAPQDTRLYWVRAYDDAGNESPSSFTEVTAIPQASRFGGICNVEPNPFNPRTRVSFTMPQAGRVRVAVYDARGRRIRLLVDDVRPAGDHVETWNGRDELGRAAPSGVYLIGIESAAWRDRRAVTLVQ